MSKAASAADAWGNPDKCGFMMKRGHRRKNWTNRWFVLQKDTLYYFKKKTDTKPVGEVPLRGVTVAPSDKFEKSHMYELEAPTIQKNFFLVAPSADERESWMSAIRQAASLIPSVVSGPYEVQHRVHVDFDSSTGYKGLPPELAALMKPFINESELQSHPKEAVAAAEFYGKLIGTERPLMESADKRRSEGVDIMISSNPLPKDSGVIQLRTFFFF
jgi:hypothetical protein